MTTKRETTTTKRKTERLDATTGDPSGVIARAAEILRAGGTVSFPTETVYGLGANALASGAVAQIFEAKQRPLWDPLIVHVCDRAMLEQIAEISVKAEELIAAFWPGPLTLLLPRTSAVPDAVTSGRLLVGVRMPAHPVALALIRAAGLPVAAPSANRFGHTSPTTAAHVLDDLDGRIDAVLDGGPTMVGVESTVLDPIARIVYRPGAITLPMIEAVLGPVTLFRPVAGVRDVSPASMPSPGVGIRHYAPRARLILVASELELIARLGEFSGDRLGIMLPNDWRLPAETRAEVFRWQASTDAAALAQSLFSGLRELDDRGVSVILCPLPGEEGLGLAIRDRLQKAARID